MLNRRITRSLRETPARLRPSGRWTVWLLCWGALFWSATAPYPATAGTPPADTAAEVAVIHPERDRRAYRYLTLDNGLRVLLISDPQADKAAASLDVRVGYFDDPPERPGLSHFLEHMLFLGTEKYPDANAFQDFIAVHGGSNNASTGAEHTRFYFDVDADWLAGALDRFAQFFIAPLFNAEFVAREVRAVESEYRLKLREDGRRFWEVQKATANPVHPFSKFSVGNAKTLGADRPAALRAALVEFFQRHYDPRLMTLAVLGRQPLAQLETLVRRHFGAIPMRAGRRQPLKPPITEPLFLDHQRGVWIHIVPVREQRRLILSFPFPWRSAYHLSKPTLLVSHLLGHEGPGSLHQWLTRKGWINGLSVGKRLVAGNYATLDVAIDLTPEGLRFVSHITGLVFQYLERIRREGFQPWIYDEIARMNALRFQYREPPRAVVEVRALARNLHHYPPALVLRGPLEFQRYRADELGFLLDALRPDNLRLILLAPDLPAALREPRYQVPYQITAIAPALQRRWLQLFTPAPLAIPGPNPFLPERPALKPLADTAPVPRRILERPGLRVWHKQDDRFRLPRANLVIYLRHPEMLADPRGRVLARLYTALVHDALKDSAYYAYLADLYYDLTAGRDGLTLSLGGLDERQALWLEHILDTLVRLRIDPARLALQRERLRRTWENLRHDRPYRQANRELLLLLQHHRWPTSSYLEILPQITAEEVARFAADFFAGASVEVLGHGNLTAAQTRTMAERIRLKLGAQRRSPPPGPRLTVLPAQSTHVRRLGTPLEDHALVVYYQGRESSIAEAARILFLQRMLKGPFYHVLRTEAQLGYVVFAATHSTLRRPGLKLVVQSPHATPPELYRHVQRFLRRFEKLLVEMTSETFENYRAGLLSDLLEEEKTLDDLSRRYAHLLALGYHRFDLSERLAAAVRTLRQEELLRFFRHWMLEAQAGRLVVEAYGRDNPMPPPAAGQRLIEDPVRFRTALPAERLSLEIP